jgi:regulator of cell morphogenesis and NO signaling
MTTNVSALGGAALVGHIVERFHEGHRRDLLLLRNLLAALPPSPQAAALAAHVAAFGAELERHLFKEEMRLFPMIEQGGHALIGALIDDITQEHAAHEAGVAKLRTLHHALLHEAPGLPAPTTAPLGAVLERLLAELAEHAALEETRLFAPFAAAPRRPWPG